MPVLHEYRNRQGMYVKARKGNMMVTYQLEPEGVKKLRKCGLGDGDKIDHATLDELISDGLAYTHGSGAGVLDEPADDTYNSSGDIIISVTGIITIGIDVDAPDPTPDRPHKSKSKRPKQQRYSDNCPTDRYSSNEAASPVPAPVFSYTSDRLPPPPTPVRALPPPSESPPLLLPPARHSESLPCVYSSGPEKVSDGRPVVDLSEVLTRVWEAVVYEIWDIPIWLWVLIAIGVLVPGGLLLSLFTR